MGYDITACSILTKVVKQPFTLENGHSKPCKMNWDYLVCFHSLLW